LVICLVLCVNEKSSDVGRWSARRPTSDDLAYLFRMILEKDIRIGVR
jgi:hypothetical protein